MAKSPLYPQPASLERLLVLDDVLLPAGGKLMLLLLIRRSKTAPHKAEQKFELDEVSAACGLSVDEGRHAARRLHTLDLADVEGRQIRLVNGADVNRLLDGTELERAPEDVLVDKMAGRFKLPEMRDGDGQTPEGEGGPEHPLDGLGPNSKVDDLRAGLLAAGVDIPEGAKKADLLALLQAALAPKSPESNDSSEEG